LLSGDSSTLTFLAAIETTPFLAVSASLTPFENTPRDKDIVDSSIVQVTTMLAILSKEKPIEIILIFPPPVTFRGHPSLSIHINNGCPFPLLIESLELSFAQL